MIDRLKSGVSRLALATVLIGAASAAQATELLGRAVLPAATFSTGPTSGQFITSANGEPVPFTDKQAVQGFSAVIDGPVPGTYYVMPDNGFGAKGNSADALLRYYAVRPDFKTGTVTPVDVNTGAALPSFNANSFVTLNDKNNVASFPIVADQTNYPNGSNNISVDPSIKSGRLLTGADFDIESFRKVKDGTFWFGEEFGPYLLHVDKNGTLLEKPYALPNTLGLGSNPFVQSPSAPTTTSNGLPALTTANLANSKGFEGMALNQSGDKLYALLEGPLTTDPNKRRLLINEFDLTTKAFTGKVFQYKMDSTANAIGDMTAINDHQFLVVERDNGQGPTAAFKKIFIIDINDVDADGFVKKTQIVDLLSIADPNNLGGNGTTNGVFTFPFVTIEDVLIVDPKTLLVINDNNYPFSAGRTAGVADNNEFILIGLDSELAVPEPSSLALIGAGALGLSLAVRRRRTPRS